MIKHRFAALLLVFVVALAISAPAAAQDESDAPQPCTADEITATLAAVTAIAPDLQTASAADTARGDSKTPADLTPSMAAWSAANEAYFTNVYATFPSCIDGVLVRDLLSIVLTQEVTFNALGLLNAAQVAAGDATEAMGVANAALVTSQGSILKSIGESFGSTVALLRTGAGVPSWLPACTEDQLKFADDLDGFEARYNDEFDALQAYLDDGTVAEDTYMNVIVLLGDLSTALTGGSGGCAELYNRTLGDLYVFSDTYSALTIGQALTYATDEEAEALTPAANYFNGILSYYLTPADS